MRIQIVSSNFSLASKMWNILFFLFKSLILFDKSTFMPVNPCPDFYIFRSQISIFLRLIRLLRKHFCLFQSARTILLLLSCLYISMYDVIFPIYSPSRDLIVVLCSLECMDSSYFYLFWCIIKTLVWEREERGVSLMYLVCVCLCFMFGYLMAGGRLWRLLNRIYWPFTCMQVLLDSLSLLSLLYL